MFAAENLLTDTIHSVIGLRHPHISVQLQFKGKTEGNRFISLRTVRFEWLFLDRGWDEGQLKEAGWWKALYGS